MKSAYVKRNGRREGFGVRGVCLAAAAVLALLLQSSPAAAGVAYYSSINYYQDGAYVSKDAGDTADAHVHYQSFSGGVGSGWSIANGESFGLTTAHADAANLKMGVSAHVYSTPANTHLSDARISTEVSNRVTVSPGSSGLALGDTTTLTIKIRLDGSMHAEATSWPGKGWSHAEMDAGLSVHDYAIQIDTGEGWWSPALASFGASSELEAYDVSKPHWQYSYYGFWDESWDTASNIDTGHSHRAWGEREELSESFHYQEGRHFDTGMLTLEFEAIVGHTLDFEGFLSLYIDAANDSKTWADFDNTLAFAVTAADGVRLDWEIVPEPGTLSLLTTGALMLLRRRR
ncbi:MAG: PEP-CTERM sorting domain-containing protein [Phycisphaerae bacterium]|nr:PEP-CTERM sorting domain-containing protein [Phycisphaerae bacterium]